MNTNSPSLSVFPTIGIGAWFLQQQFNNWKEVMEHTKNGVPLFNKNNYALQKGRMEVYLLVQGYEVWGIVQNGFTSTADEQGKMNLANDAKKKEYYYQWTY